MKRIAGVSAEQAGPLLKLAYFFTRRSARQLTGRAPERMLDPLVPGSARPARHADDAVALVEQQLGEIRAVLAGDPGDQGRLPVGHRGEYREGSTPSRWKRARQFARNVVVLNSSARARMTAGSKVIPSLATIASVRASVVA